MLKITIKPNTNNISPEDFNSLFLQYHEQEGFTVLDTVINFESCSIAFLSPIKKYELFSYQELSDWFENTAQNYVNYEFNERVPCLAGFFSYEAFNQYENIPLAKDNLKIPLACFYLYQDILIYRHKWKQIKHFRINENDTPFWTFQGITPKLIPDFTFEDTKTEELEAYSNFTKDNYKNSVSEIIEEIYNGNVYQVNLSQQFTLPFKGKVSDFYFAINQINPASYGGFLNHKQYQIISNSPELFLSCDGKTLQTAPIKGTILKIEDNSNALILKESTKNLAELSMIVDLERNDLGKIAKPGSVSVQNHAKILNTSTVHHLVSEIICNLATTSLLEIFKAVFPSGSITGAPKISAMNLISKFEPSSRGVYTGAIGYFCTNNSFNFNVAIRSCLFKEENLIFSAGGGIVSDSNPEEEYLETLAKSIAIFKAYKTVNLLN